EIAANLADIRFVNKLLRGASVLTRAIERVLGSNGGGSPRRITLLDVGAGTADLPTAVAQWSISRGLDPEVVALDVSATNLRLARRFGVDPRIGLVAADGLNLPFPDRSFDFVTASHFIHHFRDGEAERILAELARVASRAVIVVDLVRNLVPYYLVALCSRLFSRNYLTWHDGPASVLSAFTDDELRALAAKVGFSELTIERAFPYRLLLIGVPGA
ncbi:MAG TPA: methyltransferase domain-containing protein, partial [Blastocatellia bacterium]|nr:methyltransferase domain-containing protein [Blastocatellia bacterium]